MTLRHMKIYITVYQTENITKAAEALYMTQPAVTRAVREIERYYGILLFDRINRRLFVTEAGKAFYAYALHIVDSFDLLEKSMRNWDELGVLRVGASITVGNFLLPKVIARFKETHPKLKIKAIVSNGGNLQKALLDNHLDFAVIEGNVSEPLLDFEVIAKDRMVPVLPPDSPYKNADVALEKLIDEPLLLRERGSAGRNFMENIFAVRGLQLDPMMESASTQAIIRSVHFGLGVSFLPEHLVKQYIMSGFVTTCRVTDENLNRDNFIVWHKNKFLTNSAKEAMNLFKIAADLKSEPLKISVS